MLFVRYLTKSPLKTTQPCLSQQDKWVAEIFKSYEKCIIFFFSPLVSNDTDFLLVQCSIDESLLYSANSTKMYFHIYKGFFFIYLVFNRVTKFLLTNHVDCISRPNICVIIKCTQPATSDVYSADRIVPS